LHVPPDPSLKYVLREMSPEAREFYARLEKDDLSTTFCEACNRFHFPPRRRCADCGGPLGWRTLSGRGLVYAFTQQERGLRLTAPQVVGIAELEEGVRVFGVFDDTYEELAIGQAIEVRLRRDVPGLTLLGFKVVGETASPQR
jgi:uncharacterized OB-fold protein